MFLITHHLENENFNFETSVIESHSGKLDLKYELFANDALDFLNHWNQMKLFFCIWMFQY